MIQLSQVSKSFAGVPALSNVSLKLGNGKTHVLLGSSGSGKSTLLRLIAGLILPDAGEILIDDRRVSPDAEGFRGIGFVIQGNGLFPHLTCAQNISLVARAAKWSDAKTAARLDELVPLAGLSREALNRFPRELSGGQQQRVQILRALMRNPDLLLLDEPLGALDPIVRSELQGELKRIFEAVGKTVVLVTHDVNEAAFFGHTVSLLHHGKLEQHGAFSDLVKRPASPFVTDFLRAQKPYAEMKEFS